MTLRLPPPGCHGRTGRRRDIKLTAYACHYEGGYVRPLPETRSYQIVRLSGNVELWHGGLNQKRLEIEILNLNQLEREQYYELSKSVLPEYVKICL